MTSFNVQEKQSERNELSQTETDDVVLKRSKRRSRRKKKESPFKLYGFEILTSIAFIGALLVLLNPFKSFIPQSERPLVQYLVHGQGHLLLGALLLLLAICSALMRARKFYVDNPEHWQRTPCPVCGTKVKKRMARKWYHKAAATITQMPLRRYICAECGWTGMLIDEHHLHG